MLGRLGTDALSSCAFALELQISFGGQQSSTACPSTRPRCS